MTHHGQQTGGKGSQSRTQTESGMEGQPGKQSQAISQGQSSKQHQPGMHSMGGDGTRIAGMQTVQQMAGVQGMDFLSGHMLECIMNCTECHSVCLATIQHCLSMGGRHADPQHIGLMMDCAEICQTSANFMLRNSHLHQRTCGVCAEACQACAQSCEQLGDDEMMRMCAEMCRRCAQSCREMAGVQM